MGPLGLREDEVAALEKPESSGRFFWLFAAGPIGTTVYMVNTKRPLEEKMTLFWHQIFAIGFGKVDHCHEVNYMIRMFREKGPVDYP